MYLRQQGQMIARMRISDTGTGMDEATLMRVFEPFFTTKPMGKGTGLGLAVVFGIVRAHDGEILAESRPGEGATFSIYLPVVAKESTLSSITPVSPITPLPTVGTLQKRLLYIDDDESLLSLIKRLLSRRGFRVEVYAVGSDALAALRADPAGFDLVVTDYNMPGMSGLDVARVIRTIRADLPVALASGFITDELRAQAGDLGIREVLFKATAVDELCDAFVRLANATD
jgi:CheY-like chemotaxis protein